MIILSHRGFWLDPAEKNSWTAFTRTVASGFGTETDVRDLLGRLVVAHDPAESTALPWSELVDLFSARGLPLAVNVKADGLAQLVGEAFSGREIDWFAFDMSGPETVRYAKAGLPFFTRHSDLEPTPILYDAAQGVWLDAFGDHSWITPHIISEHLENGKRICLVSPELHGRDPFEFWATLKTLGSLLDNVMLCTDIPTHARDHFSS